LPGEVVHVQDQSAEALSKRREGILDARAPGGNRSSRDGADEFEFPELSGEDFLTDAGEGATKLAMASRALEELAQNEDFPLAADDGQ